MAAVGTNTDGTKVVQDQLMDGDRHRTAARTLQTSCGKIVKPMSGLVPPVVTKMGPTNGTGMMHYEWIVRESVRTTEMLMPVNYLEVPELKLPMRFLHLAAEARTVEIMNDKLCCLNDVQPQGNGLPNPVLVTVMMDSPVRQCKPINRVDRGVSPDTTGQPLLLGLNTDEREDASTDVGGSDANLAKQSKPVDHDLFLADRKEIADRPVLMVPHNATEQSVFLGLDVGRVEHAPAHTMVPDVVRYRDRSSADGPAEQDETRRPVGTEWKHAENDAKESMAGGPVGQLGISDPLRPVGYHSGTIFFSH